MSPELEGEFFTINTYWEAPPFSKSSLYIWKFSVHKLLKSSLKDSDHNLASMWNEHNSLAFEHFLALPSFGIRMKLTFSSPVTTAEFHWFADILSAAR